MTIGIRFAARSDVGLLREGNEDSAYAGPRLLAVADGMGGHVGGEIASAAAIDALKPLDTEIPSPELLAALERAVQQANETLHNIVESDPTLQGMGTTLTAMLWSGPHVAVVHIGDSRAYLLRNGELFQITHDHTLVQSLVDEGRISVDEAASHPQRSLLLRALDGRGVVEPDVSLREAQVGDRYLLCSDGLSGVVSAETIHHALSTLADPEQAVRRLIDLANRGGGPDNITCVVADVVDVGTPLPTAGPVIAGAASNASRPPAGPAGGSGAMAADTPAGRAAALRDTMPQPVFGMNGAPPPGSHPMDEAMSDLPVRPRRRWTWLIVAWAVVVLMVGAGGVLGWRYTQNQYYVGASDGDVVIFRGINEKLGGMDMFKIAERPQPPLAVSDLPTATRSTIGKTIEADNLTDARGIVTNLRRDLCTYTVTVEGRTEDVVIVQGKGQNGCEVKVTPSNPQIRAAQLPTSKAAEAKKGISAANLQQAQQTVQGLRDAANQCSNSAGAFPDCPKKP